MSENIKPRDRALTMTKVYVILGDKGSVTAIFDSVEARDTFIDMMHLNTAAAHAQLATTHIYSVKEPSDD